MKGMKFSQAVIGKKSSRSARPSKSIGKIAAPSVGKVGNGVKAAPTKSGGKRIF